MCVIIECDSNTFLQINAIILWCRMSLEELVVIYMVT